MTTDDNGQEVQLYGIDGVPVLLFAKKLIKDHINIEVNHLKLLQSIPNETEIRS